MGKGERFKKNENSILTNKINVKNITSFLLFIFFLILFIISGKKVINYLKDARNNKELYAELSQYTKENEDNTSNKYNIDFASLKQKNSDTVGFIKVNGTDVNHIVVKGTDNNFYLTRNFEKEYNVSGWIFADYRNKLDGSDKNIIIYGHNTETDNRFTPLLNYKREEFYQKHKYIELATNNGLYRYEIFSVYSVDATKFYYIDTEFESQTDYDNFITSLVKKSRYDTGVEVTAADSILTLSTCDYSIKNGRFVVQARLVKTP